MTAGEEFQAAWDAADSATRNHWIDELVSFSDKIAVMRRNNAERRRRAAEAGVSYEEMLRRDNEKFWAQRNAAESAKIGTDRWNSKRRKNLTEAACSL